MSEEDIKQLMKEEMLKTIKNDLHSEMIFVYVDNLEKENKQLQQKIDKAIEYIKENKASLPMGRDEFTCEMRYSDDVVLAHKLLEILGDKENE